jgi:hypothetical protein
MRLHFVLPIVAACKLASSLPISDESQCALFICDFQTCCPGYMCQEILDIFSTVSMSSFHLNLWLTDVLVLCMCARQR